jgi:hypothetical protein
MSQAGAGFDQIPYYREYLEHILKPRVMRAIEEVRVRIADRVWSELIAKMAEDQRAGGAADPESQQKIRAMLEQGLRLQLHAAISASFGAAPGAENGEAMTGPVPVAAESRSGDVVERGFPDNPLARAVGGVRRIAR